MRIILKYGVRYPKVCVVNGRYLDGASFLSLRADPGQVGVETSAYTPTGFVVLTGDMENRKRPILRTQPMASLWISVRGYARAVIQPVSLPGGIEWRAAGGEMSGIQFAHKSFFVSPVNDGNAWVAASAQ